jgi:putative DNA primase/helicase
MKLQYDALMSVAIGRHRRDKSWKNKEIAWSDLLKRFATTHRTAETYKEFLAETKTRQDVIKDVGGFVGGHISGGRRTKTSVLYKHIVTLDIDFSDGNIWEDYTLLYHNAAAIHTTHKHGPASPRFRLIIPLDRHVRLDEYEAIARKIAGNLEIDLFDPTTFQPNRLMYWPSTSSDGEYLFEYQDGPFINADEILASYIDWQDSSQWPKSSKELELPRQHAAKQGDPTEKEGLIGAFCRCYTIHEAIEEFLYDVYEKCEEDNRYTYKLGTTTGGLITYDDMYAYSWHGSDPSVNKLCNAFDLVRIHKFGILDDEDKQGVLPQNLPSFKHMSDFVAEDKNVRKLMAKERLKSATEDFADEFAEDEPVITELPEIVEDSDEWLGLLERTKKGIIKQTIYNVSLVLDNDPKLRNRFAFDEFRREKLILKKLPWRKVSDENRYLKDEDEAALRKYLERNYDLTGRLAIKDALETHIAQNSFHPVKKYLSGLKWDETPRLDALLIKYLGAKDNDYTRAVTRKTFVAAVARIFKPGCKFDHMLTFVGEEGKGKSTLFAKLAGEWFSDSFTTFTGEKAFEQLQGHWIIEVGELSAMRRAEVETVKHFISKQKDSYRPAYGHNTLHLKRQCILVATTNDPEPLRGSNGNRKFWILDIGATEPEYDIFDKDSINDFERAQIWAEAIY